MAILEGEPGDPVIILANGAVEPIMGPVGPFAVAALTTVAGPAAATIFWTFAFEITGAKAVAFFLFRPGFSTGLTTVAGALVGETTTFSMMPAGANVSFSGAVAVAFFLFRPAPVDLTTAGALAVGAEGALGAGAEGDLATSAVGANVSSFGLLSTGLF